ncbi:hypothetical protein ABZP36_020412 [Zizania latifolia]
MLLTGAGVVGARLGRWYGGTQVLPFPRRLAGGGARLPARCALLLGSYRAPGPAVARRQSGQPTAVDRMAKMATPHCFSHTRTHNVPGIIIRSGTLRFRRMIGGDWRGAEALFRYISMGSAAFNGGQAAVGVGWREEGRNERRSKDLAAKRFTKTDLKEKIYSLSP